MSAIHQAVGPGTECLTSVTVGQQHAFQLVAFHFLCRRRRRCLSCLNFQISRAHSTLLFGTFRLHGPLAATSERGGRGTESERESEKEQ